jgi:hypothetical protein
VIDVLLVESQIDILNEESIRDITGLVKGLGHADIHNILSRVNLAETRRISLEGATWGRDKPVPSLLVKGVKVTHLKGRNKIPKCRMDNVIVIQKIDQTILHVLHTRISLGVPCAASRRSRVADLKDLWVVKYGLYLTCGVMDNNPLVDHIQID